KRICCRNLGSRMLSILQCGKHLRDMPFPRRSDVDEIKVITGCETLEVSFTICVDSRRFLTSLLNQLRGSNTFVFDYVANSIHNHLIDRQELLKRTCSPQTNTYDAQSNNIARFKLYTDHSRVC